MTSPNRRSLVVQFSILAATFAALNLAMLRFAHLNAVQLGNRISANGPIDTLFIGNSLIEAGADTTAFAAGSGATDSSRIFNAGLGATGTVEYQVVLRKVLERHDKLQTIIIGTYDTQVTDTIPRNGDLHGNAIFSYLNNPAIAANYYTDNAVSRFTYLATARIPYLTLRDSLWERVELLRRRIATIGNETQDHNNAFGRRSDFTALEAGSTDVFNRTCNDAVSQKSPLVAPFAELLNLARQHATRVFVVEMPMPARHRRLFYSSDEWHAYQAYKAQLLIQNGARYIDASNWLTDETDFQDVLHMNPVGAAAFSRRLGNLIRSVAPANSGASLQPVESTAPERSAP